MVFGIADSVVFGSAWTTAELRALFSEEARTRGWLSILATLVETQAELDLVPEPAARAVAATCRQTTVDAAFLTEVASGRERTGHSTAGLVAAIARRCPEQTGEWFYVGATVQDVTDTWTMQALQVAHALIRSDLKKAVRAIQGLARAHRDTPMIGRTHGQHGLPITFGFKVVGWGAELGRHQERLAAIEPRLGVVQLAGGVGSLSSFGPRALAVQERFADRLGMRIPEVSWTSSRDVFAEWCTTLALICGTGDRIGREIYNLSRTEIGELAEGTGASTIGSITMPHKRNPEIAEHLGTLARAVRCHAGAMLEGMVHDHERDGRSWKGEWYDVPAATVLGGTGVRLLGHMLATLVVDPERMRENLDTDRGFVFSEAVMLALASRTGKQTAHRLVSEAARNALRTGDSFRDAVLSSEAICEHLAEAELRAAFSLERASGQCAAMVDRWLHSSTVALEGRER